MYFLSRRICGRYRILPSVVLASTYFGLLWPTTSHHVDSNFFALLSVACVIVWQDRRKNIFLLITGVLTAATACFHLPKGILLVSAIVVWLWVQYRKRLASPFSIGFLTGSYVGTVSLVLIYFWTRHALWDLIDANFLWPSTHYGAANVVPYAQGIFRDYWLRWAVPMRGVKWTVVLASVLIIPFAFVAVLPALLPILGYWNRKNPIRSEIVLYWMCGGAIWLSEIHRKDIYHLVFGAPLLIILCIYYLRSAPVRRLQN